MDLTTRQLSSAPGAAAGAFGGGARPARRAIQYALVRLSTTMDVRARIFRSSSNDQLSM
jgi:hypothetical protein